MKLRGSVGQLELFCNLRTRQADRCNICGNGVQMAPKDALRLIDDFMQLG